MFSAEKGLRLVNKTRNKLLMIEAQRWLGIQEIGGNNRGQVIRMFQRTIGKAQNEPWCMSFVQYCCCMVDTVYAILQERQVITHQLYPSELCSRVWERTSKSCRLEAPEPGCVVIWQYHATSAGHTGIVTHVDKSIITTVEGNTGDLTKRVVREGDGVFRKRRPLKTIGRMEIIGFLNPWPGSV